MMEKTTTGMLCFDSIKECREYHEKDTIVISEKKIEEERKGEVIPYDLLVLFKSKNDKYTLMGYKDNSKMYKPGCSGFPHNIINKIELNKLLEYFMNQFLHSTLIYNKFGRMMHEWSPFYKRFDE